MKATLLLLFCGALLLNSCRSYIGQQEFTRAEYSGYCLPTDITPNAGRTILSDGSRYYIELPRYRKMPCALNWAEMMGVKFCMPDYDQAVNENDLYLIPTDLALYLSGRSSHIPSDPFNNPLTRVKNPSEVKSRCTVSIPIVNAAPENARGNSFECTSPYAGAHRAAGYAATVLLDVPISVAQNAALLGAFGVGAVVSIVSAPVMIPVTRQMQQRPATEQVETPTQTSAPVTEAQD